MDAAFKDVKASCRGKKVIIRFSSAYHGHISGVDYLNCGVDHVFLKECSQQSIDFIEKYHYRIAAVVVNPMQHFTGVNKPSPPGEKLNMSSRIRQAVSKDDYAKWLHSLQDKCNYCTKYLTKVAFIVDDIYFGFRTPDLFSMKHFTHPDTGAALKPNVLVIGKSVAAGYPLSIVLGQKGYLNTYDKKYLLQVNKTVGTLSAWHGGIVASNVFLEAMVNESFLSKKGTDQISAMVSKCELFTVYLNEQFIARDLPVRIRNFSNTFSIDYLNKTIYNSRYPQYLMAEGIYLGNYSTGKFNINADATNHDFKQLAHKFVDAGLKMKSHAYFEPMSGYAKMKLMLYLVTRFTKNNLNIYYDQIMTDKHIDIEVSHNHPVNKFGHFWSSVFMILVAYPYIFVKGDALLGCLWFFLTHFVRQTGHFFYEQQDRNIEKLKFGHKDASKKEAVLALVFAALMYHCRLELYGVLSAHDISIPTLSTDQYVSLVCLFTIVPHYVEITYQFGYLRGVSWMLKILTDPLTDLIDFYNYCVIHPKWFFNLKDQTASYNLDINTKKITKVTCDERMI
jgi:glutamate-1-semialdehyde aminotransferase